MKKSLIKIMIFVVVIAFCFSLIGCNEAYLPIIGSSNVIVCYEKINLTMNAGDTYAININEHFKDSGIDFVKYELLSSNLDVVKTDKNILTAVDAGMANIQIVFYEKTQGGKGLFAYFSTFAKIFVINGETMIPITTPQELQDMSLNLTGKYILKADIDLDGFNWQPVGYPVHVDQGVNEFSGMLINPFGYIIKNLSINSAQQIDNNASKQYAGLFGYVRDAYIGGLILQNAFINTTDLDDDKLGSSVGTIAASALMSYIVDCKVEGEVHGIYNNGGIVGSMYWGSVINCEFSGIVVGQRKELGVASGGIAGYAYGWGASDDPMDATQKGDGIINCKVTADITTEGGSGGIAGQASFYMLFQNCTFDGMLFGDTTGEIYAYKW